MGTQERVIVCGCRDWDDRERLESALSRHCADRIVGHDVQTLVFVHGDCPTGADKMADDLIGRMRATWSVYTEAHQADWDTDGPAAGPLRNEKMAKLGATVCFAFWDGKSKGTADMIRRATAHGIPVRIIPKAKPLDPAVGKESE